jgi:nucleoside diphosphate kinase
VSSSRAGTTDAPEGANEPLNGSLAIPGEACVPMPRWLSSSEFKRRLYGTDTYAIEGLEALKRALGEAAQDFCRQHAFLVVKPEAIVTRQLGTILAWLEQAGFRLVYASSFRFTPAMTRALWGYHWNAVTGAHRRAIDLLVGSGPSVAIVVAAVEVDEVPATLRLVDLKGSADPARRRPGQLRYELGSFNRLLNHVHSPDEPIDLLRELAVVLSPSELDVAFEAARSGACVDAADLAQELAASVYPAAGPEQALDLADVLGAVEPSIGPVTPESLDSEDLLRRCDEADLTLTRWQRVVLATALAESMREDVERLVPSVSASDWLESDFGVANPVR